MTVYTKLSFVYIRKASPRGSAVKESQGTHGSLVRRVSTTKILVITIVVSFHNPTNYTMLFIRKLINHNMNIRFSYTSPLFLCCLAVCSIQKLMLFSASLYSTILQPCTCTCIYVQKNGCHVHGYNLIFIL